MARITKIKLSSDASIKMGFKKYFNNLASIISVGMESLFVYGILFYNGNHYGFYRIMIMAFS